MNIQQIKTKKQFVEYQIETLLKEFELVTETKVVAIDKTQKREVIDSQHYKNVPSYKDVPRVILRVSIE